MKLQTQVLSLMNRATKNSELNHARDEGIYKQGYLITESKFLGQRMRRWYRLFGTALYRSGTNPRENQFKLICDVYGAEISAKPGSVPHKIALLTISGMSFEFQADNDDEAIMWIWALRRCANGGHDFTKTLQEQKLLTESRNATETPNTSPLRMQSLPTNTADIVNTMEGVSISPSGWKTLSNSIIETEIERGMRTEKAHEEIKGSHHSSELTTVLHSSSLSTPTAEVMLPLSARKTPMDIESSEKQERMNSETQLDQNRMDSTFSIYHDAHSIINPEVVIHDNHRNEQDISSEQGTGSHGDVYTIENSSVNTLVDEEQNNSSDAESFFSTHQVEVDRIENQSRDETVFTISNCTVVFGETHSDMYSRAAAMNPLRTPGGRLVTARGQHGLAVDTFLEHYPYCAECSALQPIWISLNYGISLCNDCAGIHARLGQTVSKIRNVLLDELSSWQCDVLVLLGNDRVSKIMEPAITIGWLKPTPESTIEDKTQWCDAKYRWYAFVSDGSGSGASYSVEANKGSGTSKATIGDAYGIGQGNSDHKMNIMNVAVDSSHTTSIDSAVSGASALSIPLAIRDMKTLQLGLIEAVKQGNVLGALWWIVHRANINEMFPSNTIYSRSALHTAIALGHISMVAFLCLHGADIYQLDGKGHSALSYVDTESGLLPDVPEATRRAMQTILFNILRVDC